MSRSYRLTPITGNTTASSEKHDKRLACRRDRRVNRGILKTTQDDGTLKNRRLSGNPWVMAKDGKQYFDPIRHPDLMRK